MVSLLSYSVHAAHGNVFLCFPEVSVFERPKVVKIIVMLSVRLYALKGTFLEISFSLVEEMLNLCYKSC